MPFSPWYIMEMFGASPNSFVSRHGTESGKGVHMEELNPVHIGCGFQ